MGVQYEGKLPANESVMLRARIGEGVDKHSAAPPCAEARIFVATVSKILSLIWYGFLSLLSKTKRDVPFTTLFRKAPVAGVYVLHLSYGLYSHRFSVCRMLTFNC